jgi:hypothetical protein
MCIKSSHVGPRRSSTSASRELDKLKLDDRNDDESAKLPTLYKIFKSLRERICDLTPRRSDMNEETLRELSVRERSSSSPEYILFYWRIILLFFL